MRVESRSGRGVSPIGSCHEHPARGTTLWTLSSRLRTSRSELLRPQDGGDEIDEAAEGDETDEENFHVEGSASPHAVAEDDVCRRDDEEHDGQTDEQDVA